MAIAFIWFNINPGQPEASIYGASYIASPSSAHLQPTW